VVARLLLLDVELVVIELLFRELLVVALLLVLVELELRQLEQLGGRRLEQLGRRRWQLRRRRRQLELVSVPAQTVVGFGAEDRMDAHMARTVARLVFGVAVKDGNLSDAEIACLDRTCAKFGVPMGRDSWAMPIADPADAAAQLAAMPAEVQHETLDLLVEAAAVDGVVHDAERRFLEAAAKAIGWTTAQLEEQIVEKLAAAKLG
jgi:uncharacterized membrane protein YebE (DUF533 family)